MLLNSTHSQGQETQAESDPRQVHMSSDIMMTGIPNIGTQTRAKNLIKDTVMVLVAKNG